MCMFSPERIRLETERDIKMKEMHGVRFLAGILRLDF